MSLPRVCILTSGVGSRMGHFASLTNKALLPIANKAIISQIIAKFPTGTEFVISLGHLGEQVQSYLALAHPTTKFHFAPVDRYEGVGSGPGYSLLCCKPHLPGPFYFVSCDTLWREPFDLNPSEKTWFASARVPIEEMDRYCCFKTEDGRITQILDKKPGEKGRLAFSGLCYIADAELFWNGLRSKELINNEVQISNGIQSLVSAGKAAVREINWIDVGDGDKYSQAVREADSEFDFSKVDELLYFVGGRVIKFFRDAKISKLRFERAQKNPRVFPKMVSVGAGFYGYEKVPGKTLYAHNNLKIFRGLLSWLKQNLWQPVSVEPEVFRSACESFYKKKTLQRVKQYQDKYGLKDGPVQVNGMDLPPLEQDLARIPWELLKDGRPSFFHGDLQFDNILTKDEVGSDFCLIDWRQDFGGHAEFGDLYYDLAKLSGGIDLNYDYIKRNMFSYQELNGAQSVFIDWASRTSGPEMQKILAAFVEENGFSWSKIQLLTAIIYLNMSPLHHEPFDKFLYALGRRKLNLVLNNVAR